MSSLERAGSLPVPDRQQISQDRDSPDAGAVLGNRWVMHISTETVFWARREPHGAWRLRVLQAREAY